MGNARILRGALESVGMRVYGGVNAPYVYASTPGGMKSWEALDKFLKETEISLAPGSGFGSEGEGFIRLSAFDTRERTEEAAERIKTRLRV